MLKEKVRKSIGQLKNDKEPEHDLITAAML